MVSDVASFLRPILKRAQAGEHVEYERIGETMQGSAALAARPRRAGPRRLGLGPRPVLHRVRHSRSQADRAGAGRARGAAASFQRQHSGADRLPVARTAATSSSTKRSCTSSASSASSVIGKTTDEVLGRGHRRHAGARPRPRLRRRSDHLRARGGRRQRPRALDPRALRARSPLRRHGQGRVRRRPRHHRPEAGAGRAGRARRASCARSWTACRRRSPISTATSAATTSTARSCSSSG